MTTTLKSFILAGTDSLILIDEKDLHYHLTDMPDWIVDVLLATVG